VLPLRHPAEQVDDRAQDQRGIDMNIRPEQTNGAVGVDQHGSPSPHKRTFKEWAVHEAKRLLVMFLYLFVLLGMFNLYKGIILRENGINYTGYGFALVNALILAKVMLIAEDLHLARGLEDKPLIYPILYKSAAFTIVLISVHLLEAILGGLFRGRAISESISEIGGGTIKGIMTLGCIMAVALIPFFAFKEIERVIGETELRSLLFTRRAKAGSLPSGVQQRRDL